MYTRTLRHTLLLSMTLCVGALLPAAQADAATAAVKATSVASLSQAEAESLLFMREEEKLARDVYLWFYQLHADNIFQTIAQSEERHTSQVKVLLDTYGLPDPAATTAPGVFQNQVLQELYDKLIAMGSASLKQALYVGGLIEEKDLRDIQSALASIDNRDIITVYTNLMDGSKNHLQSFVARIEALDGAYTPQILSEEEFNAAVN